ncbi:MAG: YibE/F family protein [Actinomycetota bacterium]
MSHRFGRVPRATQVRLSVIAGVLAVATIVGLFLLRPTGEERKSLEGLGFTSETYSAVVEKAEELPCEGQAEGGVVCRFITFKLTEGPNDDEFVTQQLVVSRTTPALEPGDKVMMAFDPLVEREFQYRYYDRERGPVLLWLSLLFAGAVVALGRLRGVSALIGLVASFVVLLQFILPAILDGRDPLMVAIFGSAAVAFIALYTAHGFGAMTTIALIGTLASLAVVAVLANLFVGLTVLSGFGSEEAVVVQIGASNVDLVGIVLGGIVIGALGAIDDMTVTQASAVWELHAANPRMGTGVLLRSALSIGRDHVASTVNTLALAYAGASMPILLLLILSQQNLATVISGEVIATEVVRTLVGSIGLVTAVPLTTALAVFAVKTSGPQPATE